MSKFRQFFRIRHLIGCSTATAAGTLLVAYNTQALLPSKLNGDPWDHNWDKREPLSLIRKSRRKRAKDGSYYQEPIEVTDEKIAQKTAKATRHIILVRHGQYNTKGKTDLEHFLTKLGREQAELTGVRLQELEITFDSIISSNMTRAVETAELILKTLGQKDLEISNKDPLLAEGPPAMPDPIVMYEDWRPELHEFYAEGARIEAAFRKHIHRAKPEQENDSYEIIVCHGNVIRYFFCRALQFPPDAWLRMNVNHTGLTIMSILPTGRVLVRTVGDSGHLPMDKVSC